MILNAIEEFSNWSGMEVKVVKSCGMWVGVKRDERLSLKLTFREQQLKIMTKDTRCGTWVSFSHWTGTGRIWSRESWRRRRRHVTNWNELTTDEMANLSQSIVITTFRRPADLVPWSTQELSKIEQL